MTGKEMSARPQVWGASWEGDMLRREVTSRGLRKSRGHAPDKLHPLATVQVASEEGNASQGLSVHKVKCFPWKR